MREDNATTSGLLDSYENGSPNQKTELISAK